MDRRELSRPAQSISITIVVVAGRSAEKRRPAFVTQLAGLLWRMDVRAHRRIVLR